MSITRGQVDTDVDDKIRNKTVSDKVNNVEDADNRNLILDYIDQEFATASVVKTSGSVTLTATPSVLPYDINSCSFGGGKCYLPSTTKIGDEKLVIAVSNNIEVRANVANTSKMFSTFNTFVTSVTLTTNQMYRFTYIGFGSGIGGATDGYWKAEILN